MTKERSEQIRAELESGSSTAACSYGLYNVNERIRLNFGEQFGISVESAYGEGTVVSIRLPFGTGETDE